MSTNLVQEWAELVEWETSLKELKGSLDLSEHFQLTKYHDELEHYEAALRAFRDKHSDELKRMDELSA